MGEVLKIFISATSADLGAARTAAKDALLTLGYLPIEQKHFGPAPETILKMLRRKIKECDAVLHIVGECYGSEPPAAGGARRSYTQREYDLAFELKKPLYLFICGKTFPYAKHKRESKEERALQLAHRKALMAAGGNKYELLDGDAELDARLREIDLSLQQLATKLERGRRREVRTAGEVKKVGRKVDQLKGQLADRASPLQRYYANLRAQFANYDNVGLPVTAREGQEEKEEPIKITALFVPPHFSDRHIQPAELDAAVREGKSLGEPLLPLFEKPGARIVLLADPGMGKSTVIQLLIATLADNDAPKEAPGLRGAIPFPFILRELVRLLPEDVKKWNWNALLDAFRRWDPRGTGGPPLARPLADDDALFPTLTGSPSAFFLIDGLDEIGDPLKREAMRDAIVEGFGAHRDARWLITSRIVGYERAEVHMTEAGSSPHVGALEREAARRGALDWLIVPSMTRTEPSSELVWAHLYFLAPFNNPQQRDFAEHWYIPRMGEAKGAQRAKEFVDAVHQNSNIRVIGRVPNLLYLMALLYRHEAQLPNGRALVYERISEAYLESIARKRKLLGESGSFTQKLMEKEQLLAIVGMKMQQMRASQDKGDKSDILVSRAQLAEWLGPRFADVAELALFLDDVARHSGLLLPRGEGVYGFAHLSFQEYYAACFLQSEFERIAMAKARPAGGLLRRAAPATVEHEEGFFAECAPLTVWHEPLLFLAEKFRASPAYTTQLLEWMFPQLADDPAKGEDWMPIAAARLLATLSIDPEVALELPQRETIWQALWQPDCAAWNASWRIAPSLLVAGSAFHAGVLQAAAATQPLRLGLEDCTGLTDLTPLVGLTGLQEFRLNGCTGLADLTPLAGLTGLDSLFLRSCTGLATLTPLAGLTGLQELHLEGCTGLREGEIEKLRKALPKTKIRT